MGVILTLLLLLSYDYAALEGRQADEVEGFYRRLAHRDFTDAGLEALDTLRCARSAEFSYLADAAFRCVLHTTCDDDASIVIFEDRWFGAYIVPDPFAYHVVVKCLEMVKPEVADRLELDRGG